MENSQFDNPDIYRFFFNVHDMVDEDGEQATTDAICSRKLTPQSKLWRFLTAFGIKPEIGKTFELEDCIGKTVMAIVEPNKAGTYNNVASLAPLPRGAGAPKQESAPAAVDNGISDFWAATRAANLTLEVVKQASEDMFGKAPANLTAEQRDELLKAMDVPF